VTENEILQELLNEAQLPPLLDDDITINKLCENGTLKANAWRARMKNMVDSGTYEIVWKRNATGGRVQTYVKCR
jgi:hypothetical protein